MKSKSRNPKIGSQLDLFGRGESPIHVPLEDLTEEQILGLPRSAFTESEWDWLDNDVQESIYENSPEDKERIEALAKFLTVRYRWASSPEFFDEGYEFENFENWLNNLVWEGRAFSVAQDLANELVASYTAAGYDEEQVKEAFKEAVEDQNNWESEFADSHQGATYAHELFGNIYIEPGDISSEFRHTNFTKFYESDVDAVLEFLENGDYDQRSAADIYAYTKEKLWDLLHEDPKTKYPSIDISEISTGMYFTVDLNHDAVEEAVAALLEDEEPAETGEPEEKRVMELKDGFYVADLSPRELPIEGKKQGICVGQPQYGYAAAVRKGKTKILSLRRPGGKPLLTFEVELQHGVPANVEQIKGKGNRLPGWDRGGTGMGKLKRQEVLLAKEIVSKLNIDPWDVDDLRPALESLSVEWRGVEKHKNPRRLSTHRPRKTFSDPVGPV